MRNTAHWVAVIGCVDGAFIVMDPNDNERCFSRLNTRAFLARAWCTDEDGPDEFFAIAIRRKDGAGPRWRVTRSFARRLEDGAEETAEEITKDLASIIARASTKSSADLSDGAPLASILESMATSVVENTWNWTAQNEHTRADLRRVFDDYLTIAAATDMRVPTGVSETAIAVQMTVILTTYAWNGGL
jgi:hypothetical protein